MDEIWSAHLEYLAKWLEEMYKQWEGPKCQCSLCDVIRYELCHVVIIIYMYVYFTEIHLTPNCKYHPLYIL